MKAFILFLFQIYLGVNVVMKFYDMYRIFLDSSSVQNFFRSLYDGIVNEPTSYFMFLLAILYAIGRFAMGFSLLI